MQYNYFEIFDLDVGFYEIDTLFLEDKYIKLQLKVNNSTNNYITQDIINLAYTTLTDKIKRYEYILMIRGIEISEIKLSPEFLNFVIEIKDLISDIDDNNTKDLESIKQTIKGNIDILEDNLNQLFIENKLQQLTHSVLKIKYLYNLI